MLWNEVKNKRKNSFLNQKSVMFCQTAHLSMVNKLNICGPMIRAVLVTFAATVLPSTVFSYGPEGHQTVGAIADKLIANSPNTVSHVRALIGNETLEHASTWADAFPRTVLETYVFAQRVPEPIEVADGYLLG